MVRAPYPARIAAGLVVTALEETRKLPTLVVTLPMTAVSSTLQFGMRLQQNIAELAIKGDAALEQVFDSPDEQPAWARFDEDEDSDDDPISAVSIPAELPGADAVPDKKSTDKPATGESTTGSPGTKASASKAPAEKAPAKKATAKRSTATKATGEKATVDKATAETSVTKNPTDKAPAKESDADTAAGRFALYSSAPADAVAGSTTTAPKAPAFDGPVPEVVEYIEYNSLTLAQLRAKLRSVELDDLSALAEYERATKARAPFLTMLDNRISAQQKRQSTT